jgi:D-beta-D-heptose 7-phosphate kinase/D-beta-D-heptose 1-phosphate adenosyltransferase
VKYYLVSGGFDPIHEGHIELIKSAACKSDGVILLLNSDDWLIRKKGKNFMSFNSRKIICENIKGVIAVIGFDDKDNSSCDGIIKARKLYPNDDLVFANGGDRTKDNIPEIPVCDKYGIKMEFGVGGSHKANSSSWILNNYIGSTKK